MPQYKIPAIEKQLKADGYKLRHDTLVAIRQTTDEELAEPNLGQLRNRLMQVANNVLDDAPDPIDRRGEDSDRGEAMSAAARVRLSSRWRNLLQRPPAELAAGGVDGVAFLVAEAHRQAVVFENAAKRLLGRRAWACDTAGPRRGCTESRSPAPCAGPASRASSRACSAWSLRSASSTYSNVSCRPETSK